MANFVYKFLILGLVIHVSLIGYSSSVPCYPNAWITIPVTTVFQQTTISATNVTHCQQQCVAFSDCTGVVWNTSTSGCSLKLSSNDSGINYNSTDNTTSYYALIRNYTTCDKNSYNCSFTWTGIKNWHGFSGSQVSQAGTVADCIRACQDNVSCQSADWNYQDATCWMFTAGAYTGGQAGIIHFPKICANGDPSTVAPTTPSRPTTPGPNTTTASTVSTSTVTSTRASSISSMNNPTSPSTTTTSTTTTTTTTTTPTASASTTTTTTTTTTSTSPTTTTTSTTTKPTTTTSVSSGSGPFTSGVTDVPPMAEKLSDSSAQNNWYPMAIRPAYIVLAGVGGGCILLVITAVVILCSYSLNGNAYSSNGTTTKTVNAYQSQSQEIDYVETGQADGGGDDMDMNEIAEMEIDKKPYGNAEEFE